MRVDEFYHDLHCLEKYNANIDCRLLKMVLQRLGKESDAVLLTSTLCLLEVSKGGLLENELIEILAQFTENRSPAEEDITDSPEG